MATPSVVASAGFNASTGTTAGAITCPTTQADDELVVEFLSRNHNVADAFATVTDTEGGEAWVLKGTDADERCYVYRRKAHGNLAGVTINVAGAINSCAGGLKVIRGAALGDPFDTIATFDTTWETNASGARTHASLTPTVPDCLFNFAVFQTAVSASDWNNGVVTVLAAATLGTLEPETWEAHSTGGSDCYLISTAKASAGGPTGTGATTWTQVVDSGNRSVAYFIKPLVAAGGQAPRTMQQHRLRRAA